MKKLSLLLLTTLLLASCSNGLGNVMPLATSANGVNQFMPAELTPRPTATASVTSTPTPNQVQTALAVIQLDAATSTARSAATATAYSNTSTAEAKSTQAFWVGVTLSVATDQQMGTNVVNTSAAVTSQSNWETQQPPTQTALAATQQIEAIQLRSKSLSIWIWKLGGSLGGVAFVFLAIYGLWLTIAHFQKIGSAVVSEKKQIKPDSQGRFPILPETALEGGKLINPNLMHRAALDTKAPDTLTNDQALGNTVSARKLEMVRNVANSPAMARAAANIMKPQPKSEMPDANMQISKPDQALLTSKLTPFALPDWSMLNNVWDGKLLPYGIGSNGLLLADPMEDPHWLLVGRTRSGKSRYGLRTVATAALTMGYQVLFIGKRVDFYPFEGHANAKIVGVDLLNDPGKYLETLRRVALLMKERDDYLTSRHLSMWQQTGLPQLFVVLDEFSSAVKQLNTMKSGAGNLVSSMATALIQEGGKYGLNIIQVVQDATGANVDISARRNMGRMVFRVSEQTASDVALGVRGDPSAVGLPARHFLSVIGNDTSVVYGAAFAPSDDEVKQFLQSRPVSAHAPMNWIEGDIVESSVSAVTDGITRDAQGRQISQSLADAHSKADEVIKIQDLYLGFINRKMRPSLAEIERAVYGRTGGSFHTNVKKAIADLEQVGVDELAGVIANRVQEWGATTQATTTASTTETMPKIGGIEPVAA